jgi:kynureninase
MTAPKISPIKNASLMSRADCEVLDSADPLASLRARFALPENTIYLDGNSLGARPLAAAARLATAVNNDWGHELIRAWNNRGWVDLPRKTGDKIAALVGATAGEVIVADSTSVNLFKLLAAVLTLPSIAKDTARRVILSLRDNFPTDLYIAQGLNALLGNRYTLKLVGADDIDAALDHTIAVALLTQVDYRSGQVLPMRALNEKSAQAGTHIVWDLSHSTGAIPLALNDDGAEFAAGCGYKYLNGGPGAPAYVYVARAWQREVSTPLSGWFGHHAPFAFETNYAPAPDISRFLCGTPSVLATIALDCGLDTFSGVSMAALRTKSLALTDLFWQLMDTHCAPFGFRCISPRAHATRGSQLSFAHDEAYAIMQALIARGVICDFRQPNLMRFGFTPLYTRFVDCYDAVMILRDIMQSGAWQAAAYQQRQSVT